jgi:hypothetical protein
MASLSWIASSACGSERFHHCWGAGAAPQLLEPERLSSSPGLRVVGLDQCAQLRQGCVRAAWLFSVVELSETGSPMLPISRRSRNPPAIGVPDAGEAEKALADKLPE